MISQIRCVDHYVTLCFWDTFCCSLCDVVPLRYVLLVFVWRCDSEIRCVGLWLTLFFCDTLCRHFVTLYFWDTFYWSLYFSDIGFICLCVTLYFLSHTLCGSLCDVVFFWNTLSRSLCDECIIFSVIRFVGLCNIVLPKYVLLVLVCDVLFEICCWGLCVTLYFWDTLWSTLCDVMCLKIHNDSLCVTWFFYATLCGSLPDVVFMRSAVLFCVTLWIRYAGSMVLFVFQKKTKIQERAVLISYNENIPYEF